LAKGRIERSFDTAQDRLVKEMRVAGVKTFEQANEYLKKEFLPWWNQTLVVQPASADDAHRALDKRYDLAAILSHVETRQVKNDYTIQFEGQRYGIQAESISTGLRGGEVRVEKRLDESVAVRFRDRYLSVALCAVAPKVPADAFSGAVHACAVWPPALRLAVLSVPRCSSTRWRVPP
jgi:hypothetical protein